MDTFHDSSMNTTLWSERWATLLRYPIHQWTRPAYKDELREHNKAMWVMFKTAYNATPATIETTLARSMHVARQCSLWNLDMTLSATLKKERGRFVILTNSDGHRRAAIRWWPMLTAPHGNNIRQAIGTNDCWNVRRE